MLKDRKGSAGCQGERSLCDFEEEPEKHKMRACEADLGGQRSWRMVKLKSERGFWKAERRETSRQTQTKNWGEVRA